MRSRKGTAVALGSFSFFMWVMKRLAFAANTNSRGTVRFHAASVVGSGIR